jgi:hypothetical protein
MNDRPRSVYETQEDMDAARDALEALAEPIIDLGEAAARAKWAYRRAQQKAIDAGAIAGCRNDTERKIAIWKFQVEPGVTVADLGEANDRAENVFRAHQSKIKALSEASRLTQSSHVTAREHMP